MIIELSKLLEGYDDISSDVLEPMLREHESTGFDIYKLEKDFLLTVLLIYFGQNNPELIFKWWTCLNKIYYDYYRLSEDLDFVVIAPDAGRKKRTKLLEKYKQLFLSWIFKPIWLTLIDKQTKFQERRQGTFELEYLSSVDGTPQTIKIDIRIELSLLQEPIKKEIIAIYKDPITNNKFFQNHTISVLQLQEMLAEKMRAALTRRDPAIRDFFDIRYVQKNWFVFENVRWLIDQKAADLPYTIDDAFEELQKQIKTELNPVLNQKDEYKFDLKETYNFILQFKK